MGSVIATAIASTFALITTTPSDFIFWCKWIISYTYIQWNRKLTKKRFDLYDGEADHDPVKVDFISAPEEIAFESPLEESELCTTADEIFCYGVNSKSECLVVRIARGCNNEAEAWIYLKLSSGKVYQLKETSGFQQSCSEKKAFTCGGLQMHYITPMRNWRIFFNGLLRETGENNATSEKMVYVKFALIWRASSDVFDFPADVNAEALARGLAKAKWTNFIPPLEKLNKALNFYAQCGIIVGTISIEGSEEEHSIYLFGERIRFLGESSLVQKADFFHVLGQTLKTGSFIHLAEVSLENIVEKLSFGFLVQPTGLMCAVSDKTAVLENLTEQNSVENDVRAKFHIEDTSYILKGKLVRERAHFQSKKGWDGSITIDCFNFHLNSFKCAGVVLKGTISNPLKKCTQKVPVYERPSVVPLVVHFSEKTCQDSAITGGKGSSLGKLTELSKELQNFIVPNGMVVTTAAYKMFITRDVLKQIEGLENVLYGNVTGDVKEACQRVADEIMKSPIPNTLREAVEKCLLKSFSEENETKFAVRSSATGEDTEQMSAAGQMETFLGVSGVNEILSAMKKCWASQFSHIAVQYKRQNGQIINSPMAVVIQNMIPCDVAGVLFTCDPLTGNPTILSITANYGLGESVVSASEEPDTIELKRDFEDKLCISNKIIGAKNRRIVLQDGKGTDLEEVSEKERQACCLSDEMAIRLGNLAIKIERSYRSHRDIEWGFWNNNLYIFQSRPVTSGTGETDFEIDHETDAPMRVENDYFTVCNVGEVMPGALSPLACDILLKYFRITFQRKIKTSWQSIIKPRYFPRAITSMYNHVMFYCCDLLERMDENKDIAEASLVALFGRAIEDDELFEVVRQRFGKKKKPFFYGPVQLFTMVTRLFLCRKVLRDALKSHSNYRIPVEKYKTSHEMFDALLYACTDLVEPMSSHMMNSESSSIWNIFIFNILKKARGGLNSDVYLDFAKLLTTSSDVESADVPASIERLAFHIAEVKKPEDFKKMDIKDILEWLENTPTVAGIKYREFLTKHGHRCLKEFDVRSKTWGTDPTTLIQLLKNLVGTVSKNNTTKKDDDVNKMISDLGLSLGFKARLFLKFLIPQSRQGVQNREASKSLLIKSQDAWRKGYHRLAQLMVSEGRIPDEDLLFFMTLDEIKELLDTRSPKIISRANHRRRRYPTLDKYIFPEIMKGFPIPINMEDTSVVSSDENFSMKGIPVSQGVAKAYVRVALTLEEASHLQAGEILLTYSTDIGWSPYFPILAGVVTELGGLISHGAVVSREYGLPCIAGLHGATRQFQTGDYVLLDGNKGILQRLPKPESSGTTS